VQAAKCAKAGLSCASSQCCRGLSCDDASKICVVPSCVPSCSGKSCGDDGCGGSCGTCSSGGCCSGVCTDLTTTSNCGACGKTCQASQGCLNGKCTTKCTPTTCAAQGDPCGSIPNGCGGTLECASCDDGNECTTDVCNAGTCENNPVADDTTCDNGAGTCQNGDCVTPCIASGGTGCDDTHLCCEANDTCDEGTGTCLVPTCSNVPDFTPCLRDDGQLGYCCCASATGQGSGCSCCPVPSCAWPDGSDHVVCGPFG
jgi:hypothetical protein